MPSVAPKSSNKGFDSCLNGISAANDAPFNDFMYHNTCWVILKERKIKRELKFYGNWNLNFLGPTDVTNDECQLIGLKKLVSIVTQLIIPSVKSPKQICRNKSIDAMRNTAEAPLNMGPINKELFPITTNRQYLNLLNIELL